MVDKNKYILTIDVGTTNLKCIVYDFEGKIIINYSQFHSTNYPKPNYAEQDPLIWTKNLKSLLNKMDKEYPDIIPHLQGVSLTGQMHGPIFLDNNGEVLYPCIIWSDTRSQDEITYLKKCITEKHILQITGNPIQESFTLPKILWFKNNYPEFFKKIFKIVFPKDYIGYQLTGNISTDHSDASGSLMYDLSSNDWNNDIIAECGINLEILPRIMESNSILGKVTPQASREFSLPVGIPVIKGGGDLATTSLATGTYQEGNASLCIGTAAQLLISLNEIDNSLKGNLYYFAHCITKKYFCLGTVPSGGLSIQWFRTLIGDEKQGKVYQELNTLNEIPLRHKLLFFPFLLGTGTPHFDYKSSAALFGLRIDHDQLDIAIAIMEGVVFAIRDSLEILSKQKIEKIIMSGGATNYTIWPKIVSNILNLPVYISRYSDSASYGAYILAMKGLNFINFNQILDALYAEEEVINPDYNSVCYYQKIKNLYKYTINFVKEYSKLIENV